MRCQRYMNFVIPRPFYNFFEIQFDIQSLTEIKRQMFKKNLFRVSIKSAILGFKVKIANVFSEINGFTVRFFEIGDSQRKTGDSQRKIDL